MADLGFCERTISPKDRKSYGRSSRVQIIVALVFASLIFAALLAFTPIGKLALPAVAVFVPLAWVVTVVFMRKTRPQYDYQLCEGILKIWAVYGGRSRKKLCEIDVRSALLIAPNDRTQTERLSEFAPEREYMAAFESNGSYFMLFDDGGRRAVLFFDADAELVRILRRYNGKTVVKF